MARRFLCVLAFFLAAPVHGQTPPGDEAPIRAALAKALPLLEKGGAGHRDNRACFACHNQGLPILALVTAKARGFRIDEEELKKHMGHISAFLAKNRDGYLKGRGQGGQAATAGYALWALELGGWKGDETTAAVAEFFLLFNKDLDHYKLSASRPPSEQSLFTAAYVALRGMQVYGTEEQKDRIRDRTEKVLAWLRKTPARDTEDRVFRLWALQRAGADEKELRDAAAELFKTQQPGGGWAQTDALKPDAYATGSALVALHETKRLAAAEPAYQRGVDFLLKTQLDDGSWHVSSRSKPFQTYFETGFPHGKDQFISVAASGWAATALAFRLGRAPR
jgi:hypothetical protein